MAFPADFSDVSTTDVITASRNNAITKKLGLTTIATSATIGHFSMPASAGIPTGNPANGIGSMVYDSTNDQLYINESAGASWKIIGVTYEEGEWTPNIEQSSSAFNGTMSYQRGDYVRIGDLVHASCWIRVSGTSTGSGTVSVTGLPFAKNEDDYQQVAVIGYNNSLALNCTRAWVNASKLTIIDATGTPISSTNGNYSGAVSDAGSTSDLSLTVTYTTDS